MLGAFCLLLLSLFSLSSLVHCMITTKGRRFVVNEGETVELPCHIQDLNDDTVVIWKRGEQVLFTDEDDFHDDQRFQLHRDINNFTLIIERVEPYDTAKYICSITSPEMSIVHMLDVNVHPTVSISPDANPLLVNVGENVVIKCAASGNPPPTVTWTRRVGGMTGASSGGYQCSDYHPKFQNGEKLPSNAVSESGQLRLVSVSTQDSDIYECVASNNVGTDARDTIEVRVQSRYNGAHESSAPWLDSTYSYIPVRLGQDINLTCRYNAEPSPQIDWFYNAFTINFSDDMFKGLIQYGTRQDNYSESILAVKNIREDNFGDYTCRVSNNLGSKEKTIHVSGRPGPPQLSANGTQLFWSVHSVDPVIEYQILYRFINDDTWQQFKSVRANKEEKVGDIWSRSEDMMWLPAGHEYELQVKARNTLGWGSLARHYITMKIAPLQADKSDSKGECSLVQLSTALFLSILILMCFQSLQLF